jgi:hypothetical protein
MAKKKKSTSTVATLQQARSHASELNFALARSTALSTVSTLKTSENVNLLEETLELVAEMEMEMGLFQQAVEVCSSCT